MSVGDLVGKGRQSVEVDIIVKRSSFCKDNSCIGFPYLCLQVYSPSLHMNVVQVLREAQQLGFITVRGNWDENALAMHTARQQGQPLEVRFSPNFVSPTHWPNFTALTTCRHEACFQLLTGSTEVQFCCTFPPATLSQAKVFDGVLTFGRLQEKWRWLEGVSPEDVAYMQRMPFSLSIPSHGCIVAHAGLVPGVPLQEQELADLILVGSPSPPLLSARAVSLSCAHPME